MVLAIHEYGQDLGGDAAVPEARQVHLAPHAPRGQLGRHEAFTEPAVAVGDVLQDVGVGVHDRQLVVERPRPACHVGRDQGFTRTSWRKMR